MDIRAGDTKPVPQEDASGSGSGSDSNSDTKSEDHYGVINEDHDQSKATSLSR